MQNEFDTGILEFLKQFGRFYPVLYQGFPNRIPRGLSRH